MHGVDQWILYVGVEKNCADDIPMYKAIDFMPVVIVENTGIQSAHINSINVWRKAFMDGAEFFCFVEDDVIVAPDFGKYMDVLSKSYKDDSTVFCINGYTGNEDIDGKFSVWRKPSLGTWGFGMWRDRAQECLDDYTVLGQGHIANAGWDVCLNSVSRRGRDAIMPLYSRCINIGSKGIHDNDDPELVESNRTWSGNDSLILDMLKKESYQDFLEISYDRTKYIKAKEW